MHVFHFVNQNKTHITIILWNMDIVAVCGLTYSDFVINRMAEIKRADLLVLSFGAVGTVDFRNEIKNSDGIFVDLCTLSDDLSCTVLCGADTDVYGIKHKSVIVADKGQLIDVSDAVNAPKGYQGGVTYRSYETSAGKIGVIVDGDIMYTDSVKAAAEGKAELIVGISDCAIDNKLILACRAAALYNSVPVLLSAKNYSLLTDSEGSIKQACALSVNEISF